MSTVTSNSATRREFILTSGVVAAASTLPASAIGAQQDKPSQRPPEPPELADTKSEDADAITEATFAEAEKLAGVQFTAKERTQMLQGIKGEVDRYRQRRVFLTFNEPETSTDLVFDSLIRVKWDEA